jgi:hypothetical protein
LDRQALLANDKLSNIRFPRLFAIFSFQCAISVFFGHKAENVFEPIVSSFARHIRFKFGFRKLFFRGGRFRRSDGFRRAILGARETFAPPGPIDFGWGGILLFKKQ